MTRKKAATAPPPTPARRWQRQRHPIPYRPDVVIASKDTLAEILIYDDCVLLGRRDSAGRWRSYPISPDALAQVLARVPISLGLLPMGTIGAGRLNGQPFLVRYVPPATARLQTPDRTYQIPLPPLVWAGCGNDYRVFALAPVNNRIGPAMPLYLAPFPNCYGDGRICWGNVRDVASASGATLDTVLKLFLEDSQFNLHLAGDKSKAYPVSVLAAWAALEESETETYPLDDLVPAGSHTLDCLLSGQAWGGRR